MNSNALVSIIVITYNSSEHILETLESAKNQSYINIELIVSDDHSTDETITICRDWLFNNDKRFVRTKLVTSDNNTGIAPNCNRGLAVAEGDWVKFIGGDDLLLESCVSTNMNYVHNSSHSFFFSKMLFTKDHDRLNKIFEEGFKRFNSEENQRNILLSGNYLTAPSSFMKKETLLKLGAFDERFPMLEDYPLWYKAVKNGYKIVFNDSYTIIYRINEESSSQGGKSDSSKFYQNIEFSKSWNNFIYKVIIKDQFLFYSKITAYNNLLEIIQFKIVLLFKNEKHFFSKLTRSTISLIKPSFYLFLIRKIQYRQ